MNRRDLLLGGAALLALTGCGPSIPSSRKRPPILAWVRVSGVSMQPTFPEESFVEAQFNFPYEDLKVGDTVIFWDYFRDGDRCTHHRLVAEQGGNWIAQGDNPVTNKVADRPWVTPDNFVARTTGKFSPFLII